FVDPDNRRPVDFKRNSKILTELAQQEARSQYLLVQRILKSWQDGRVKLYVTYKALNIRRAYRDLFEHGDYIPLQVHGEKREHIFAFARIRRENWILTVVPRLLTELITVGDLPFGQGVWKDDKLLLPNDAPECWLNVLTEENVRVLGGGKQLSLSDIFNVFPVALLKSI
ncbi:malto-oligosyltrehalose synthase, partial [Chloroflexota bacterium]